MYNEHRFNNVIVKNVLIICLLVLLAACISLLPATVASSVKAREAENHANASSAAGLTDVAVVIVQGPGSTSAQSSANLLRLHVVANSNDESDQQLKNRVRDALLETHWPSLAGVRSNEEAEEKVLEMLPSMAETAMKVLREHGSEQLVRIEKGSYWFPDKNTNGRIVPAGKYKAVRVILGNGEGANWWCVMFPPLCITTTQSDDWEATPASDVADAETMNELPNNGTGYAENPWDVEAAYAFRLDPSGHEMLVQEVSHTYRERHVDHHEQARPNQANQQYEHSQQHVRHENREDRMSVNVERSRDQENNVQIRWAFLELGQRTTVKLAQNVNRFLGRLTHRTSLLPKISHR